LRNASISLAPAGLARRIERRVSARLGVRPVPLVRLNRVVDAAATPTRLVAPVGTPPVEPAGTTGAEAHVAPPPGMSQFAAEWLFGEGTASTVAADPPGAATAPPDPLPSAPAPVDARTPARPRGSGMPAPAIARSRLARRAGRVVERPAGTAIARTSSEAKPSVQDAASMAPVVDDGTSLGASLGTAATADVTPEVGPVGALEAAGGEAAVAGGAPPVAAQPRAGVQSEAGARLEPADAGEPAVSPPPAAPSTGAGAAPPPPPVSASTDVAGVAVSPPAASPADAAVPAPPLAASDASAAPRLARTPKPAANTAVPARPMRLSRTPAGTERPRPPVSLLPAEERIGGADQTTAVPRAEPDGGTTIGGPASPPAEHGGPAQRPLQPTSPASAPSPAPAILRLRGPGADESTPLPVIRPVAAASPGAEGRFSGSPERSAARAERPGALRRLLRAVTSRREQPAPVEVPATSGAPARGAPAQAAPAQAVAVGTTRLARAAVSLPPVGLEEPEASAAEAHLGGEQTPSGSSGGEPLSAARLAVGTGATIARSASGAETVTFAPPPDASPAAPATSSAPAEGAAAAGASPAPAPAPGASAPGVDVDEVYDRVVERLRHDLVTEYERIGRPLDHLPHC
jgi:DNA polymerase-3 subunit gamma/tau